MGQVDITLRNLMAELQPTEPERQVRCIVRFKKRGSEAVVEEILRLSGNVRHQYSAIDAIAATVPIKALAALSQHPTVISIEADRGYRILS